jgi:hypothetical protein
MARNTANERLGQIIMASRAESNSRYVDNLTLCAESKQEYGTEVISFLFFIAFLQSIQDT